MKGISLNLVEQATAAEPGEAYPESGPPEFRFEDGDPDVLVIHYRSARRPDALAEGMIAGAGTHAGAAVSIIQDHCMISGDDHCTMRAMFEVG